MTILKDVSVIEGESNLVQQINQEFNTLELHQMQQGLQLLVEALPDDNLTQWSKDNANTSYTAQAVVLNGMATGLHYALAGQNKMLDKVVDSLREHQEFGSQSTEFWNSRAESLLERIAVIETNIEALYQVFQAVKAHYKRSTSEEWVLWQARNEVSAAQTATSLLVKEKLSKLSK